MTDAQRAAELERVERELDDAGCDFRTAQQHGDETAVASARDRLRKLGRQRLRLRYPR